MVPFVNSFQLPNALVDEYMEDMPLISFKCYVFIARKTLGWQKESDAISLSQFQSAGISRGSRSALLKSLKYLEDKNLITVNRDKNINNYKLVPHKYHASTSQVPVASTSQVHTKDTITKDTITKESKSDILDGEFDLFWKYYPRKDAKLPAKKSFKRLNKTERTALLSTMPQIIENYKTTQKQHIPLPASFINAQRWEDEVYMVKKIAKEGGEVVRDVELEECLRRFKALSEGDDVVMEEVDRAVARVFGVTLERVADDINVYGMGAFKKSVMKIWEQVK